MIEDMGWFWNHADRPYLIVHDYVIANYVCSSGKHYPLEFRRFASGKKAPKASWPEPEFEIVQPDN